MRKAEVLVWVKGLETWHRVQGRPWIGSGGEKSKRLGRLSVGWTAELGYELLLDDSNISAAYPECGISVVVIKRMSSACSQGLRLVVATDSPAACQSDLGRL